MALSFLENSVSFFSKFTQPGCCKAQASCKAQALILQDQKNDFLPVSALKFIENVHFDLPQVTSKRVEEITNKLSNSLYVPNIL
jgi:hypothetical protein